MSTTPEKNNFTPEHVHDAKALEQLGDERHKELEKGFEKESQKESLSEAHEALEKVLNAERRDDKAHEREKAPSTAEKRNNRQLHSKAEQDKNFDTTMGEVRGQMSAPSRAFSKVIHNKVVEKVSEAAASSIARPNAILTGAIFAFVLTLGVYLLAKNLGYPLSGFETIGAFLVGWVLGLVYDFLKVMVTGRNS
jgi:membrane-associated HD superfamily phosphohydrolase